LTRLSLPPRAKRAAGRLAPRSGAGGEPLLDLTAGHAIGKFHAPLFLLDARLLFRLFLSRRCCTASIAVPRFSS
jgi:hypothetical protein